MTKSPGGQIHPHVKDEEVKQTVVTTTQELFADFNTAFPKIWAAVNDYLRDNQALLNAIEADLVADFADVYREYQANFTQMSASERQKALGFELKDEELDHFARFMADMHEVQAVIFSAAGFVKKELVGENTFQEVMNDNIRRSTFFWVLDNTFYEVLYYFLTHYGRKTPSWLSTYATKRRPSFPTCATTPSNGPKRAQRR